VVYEKPDRLKDKTIGIVGVGNVGSKVEKLCRIIGMNVLLNDPPRERLEGSGQFVPLAKIQREADIITLHVPLNYNGADATFHLVENGFLQNVEKKPLLINSCRGEVTETNAIKNALRQGIISGYIADCWENEPTIDLELLNLANYGTPHIAGYSKDGKANGTLMCVRAISSFFNLGIDNWKPENIELPENTVIEIDGNQRREYSILAEAILSTYDIETDDEALRNAPHLFEQLRGDYPLRREFDSYTIKARNVEEETLSKLRKMGFNVEAG
jgi:erythronate-4-phosphate dehydrogenase